jgi:hypothetical protein
VSSTKNIRFDVAHSWCEWKCIIEVQGDKGIESLREIYEFRHGELGESFELEHQHDALCLIASRLMVLSMDWLCDVVGQKFGEEEGGLPLDGSRGLLLVECDEFVLSSDDFNVVELMPRKTGGKA